MVIQTTSVGLYPNCDDAVIEDEDFYKRAAVGVDIIYNPAETKFMKLMKVQGKPAYNGLKCCYIRESVHLNFGMI